MQKILADPKLKHFVAPEKFPIALLEVKKSFDSLTKNEKLYSHYLNQAAWSGFPITVKQTSEESDKLFSMIHQFYSSFKSFDDMKETLESKKIENDNIKNVLNYFHLVIGNGGNYQSFGDTKIIPRIEMDEMKKVLEVANSEHINSLFEEVKEKIFSLDSHVLELGFHENYTNSTYYNTTIKKTEIIKVNDFLKSKSIGIENTRIFKLEDGSYLVKIASIVQKEKEEHTYDGEKIIIEYGDFKSKMERIAKNLEKAKEYCSRDIEKKMLSEYLNFYKTGSIDMHKESQKHWVKNIAPVVETNLGFIESYRDPAGARGEYESWVSIVDKETSKKFAKIVKIAENLISELPWNKNYKEKTFEKEKFVAPDFTGLQVLSFCCSGVPLGINIPNYDDIRDNIGFKNVSLQNVLSAKSSEEEEFLTKEDEKLFHEHYATAMDICVANHELIGHGSGRLLRVTDGKFNFDKDAINPLTGKAISSWYKKSETWETVFKEHSNPIEECRAESVAIYLAYNKQIQEIFDIDDTVSYVVWLEMVLNGLKSLAYYSPESKKWLQAHCQARYCILKVLLEAGNGLLELKKNGEEVKIHLDEKKIPTVGMKTMTEFLTKLNVYKATADTTNAIKMFSEYSKVDDEFLKIREIVVSKKKPRRVFVQPNTRITESGDVELLSFSGDEKGMYDSFLSHFPTHKVFE